MGGNPAGVLPQITASPKNVRPARRYDTRGRDYWMVPEDDADMIAPWRGGSEPELSAYEDTLETVEVRTAEKVSKDLKRQAGG